MENEKKENKVWSFIKKHKKEIIIGVGVTATGIVLYAIGKKKLELRELKFDAINEDLKKEFIDATKVPAALLPKLDVGTLTDFKEYDGSFEVWAEDIPVSRLGEFGKELCEKIEGVNENTKVWSLIELYKDKVEQV